MLHSVEHAEPVVAPYFEWLPFEVAKHLCDASWGSCCESVEDVVKLGLKPRGRSHKPFWIPIYTCQDDTTVYISHRRV